MFRRIVWISLVTIASALCTSAQASTDDIQVSFAAPTYSTALDGRPPLHEIPAPSDRTAGFSVVIQNTSTHRLQMFAEGGSSYGDRSLSFQMTTPDGKKVMVRRKLGVYRGFIRMVELAPGECWVRPVWYSPLSQENWEGLPQPAAGQKMKVTLEAVFEQRPEPGFKVAGLWDGKVVSQPMEFTFVGG